MAGKEFENHQRAISYQYLNASLQRAKKMPPLKKLLKKNRPPKMTEIVGALNAAPTHQEA